MAETIELTNPVNGHRRHAIFQTAANAKAAMIIIHGFGEHSGRYVRMMEHLAQQGIATFAIDLEGHGQSGRKSGVCKSYDIFHGDVALALDSAKKTLGDLPQILFGHSMGGGIVLNHGLKKAPDVKGYIASAPLIRPVEPLSKLQRMLASALRKILPNIIVRNKIVGSRVTTIPDEQKKYEQDPLNHANMGMGMGVDIILAGEWVEANADRWEAPLLLLHARQDQLTRFESSEAFAAKAKNCIFMPMENCEHEMHNDVTQEAVYTAITEFVLDHA